MSTANTATAKAQCYKPHSSSSGFANQYSFGESSARYPLGYHHNAGTTASDYLEIARAAPPLIKPEKKDRL